MTQPQEFSLKLAGDRRRSFAPGAKGFTLIELLVVLGIIVLIAAGAVPAFRFIIGSRSLEGAGNIVSGMVAKARAQALKDQLATGVFFYYDPNSERSSMILVHEKGDVDSYPDAAAYKGWTDFADQPIGSPYGGAGTTGVQYYDQGNKLGPSFVAALQDFTNSTPAPTPNTITEHLPFPQVGTSGRLCTKQFQCYKSHTPALLTPQRPPLSPPWGPLIPQMLDALTYEDAQVLPAGVGVQLINDDRGRDGRNTRPFYDRYLRTGCLMFDAQGRFISRQYDVMPNDALGIAIGLSDSPTPNALRATLANYQVIVGGGTVTGVKVKGSAAIDGPPARIPGPNQSVEYWSQFGLVLYDLQEFKNTRKTTPATTVVQPQPFTSDMDWITQFSLRPGRGVSPLAAPGSIQAERDEETWLDNNSTPFVVDRYNGTLIKGE